MGLEALKAYSKEQKQRGSSKPPKNNLKPLDGTLTAHVEREDKAWEYNKKQAENIIKSADLRIKINKGVQQGEDIQSLLLTAIECISIMTGEKLFYDNNIKALKQR